MATRDVRQALLTHPLASVRVLALTHLEHRPLDDPDLVMGRAQMLVEPPVQTILEAQYPDGYWMHRDLGISPRYRATVWQIIFLAQLGLGPLPPTVCDRIARALELILRDNVDSSGALRLHKGVAGRSLDLTGAVLWAVAKLGLATASSLGASWVWVMRRMREAEVPPHGAVWVRRAVAAWTGCGLATPELPPPPDDGDAKAFKELTFPLALQMDELAVMEMWVELGQPDRITEDELRNLRAKRLPSDYWPLERIPGPLWWEAGTVGAPNPWITLRALRVLDAVAAYSPLTSSTPN